MPRSVRSKLNRWGLGYSFARYSKSPNKKGEACDLAGKTCADNANYLRSFLPQLNGRLDAGYRAGIDTSGYAFRPSGREPFTLLFLGSFRHLPNVEALDWFLREVFPRIRKDEPRARLVIVGKRRQVTGNRHYALCSL